jgi:hypothetical protein
VLTEVATVPEVNRALFEILETQRILASGARLNLLAAGAHNGALMALLASGGVSSASPPPLPQHGH